MICDTKYMVVLQRAISAIYSKIYTAHIGPEWAALTLPLLLSQRKHLLA